MVRSPCFDKSGLKKGAWSPEEDKKLRDYIQKYGHWNWGELPRFAGLSRCGKSCRLRWMNYLRPNVKRGNYTKEEDDLIIKLHEELGNKWSVIATKLPRRTDNEIKNHWHTLIKRRKKPNQLASEVKEHSSETSQCEANQKEGLEPKNVFADDASPQILESSPLSSETFEELGGDFWTEPFVADNSYIQNDFPSFVEEGGFISPYVSYYDDSIDLFY